MENLVTDGNGNFKYLDPVENVWKDAPVNKHQGTGEFVAFDGVNWVDVTDKMPKSEPQLARSAGAMSPDELEVARTKNNPLGEYLRSVAAQRREGESEADRFKRLYGSVGTPGQGMTAVRGFLQGATLGLGDEATAALASKIRNQPYEDVLASERYKLKAGRQAHPVTAIGSEVVGAGLTTAALPTTRLAMAPATTGGRILAGAGVGGGEAALYGFNAGEGGFEKRAKEGLAAAPLGMAFGGVAPVVGRGLEGLISSYNKWRLGRAAGVSGDAAQMVQDAVIADRIGSGSGAANIRRAGEDAMLADAGPATQGLLDAAIVSSGNAARDAGEAIIKRVNRASSKMKNTLDFFFGKPKGVGEQAERISKSTANARGEAYRRAYSSAIDYASETGKVIEETVDRIPPRILNDAINKANEAMRSKGERNMQILFELTDDGELVFVKELPNVQQLDYIKRALQGMAREEVDQFGRRTAQGNMMSDLAIDLRNAVGNAVDGYKEALKLGGDKIAMDEALEFGYDLFNNRVTREQVSKFTKGMVDAERAQLLQGVRIGIDDKLANIKRTITDPNVDAREALQALKDFSSRAARTKLVDILGPAKARALFKQINEITSAFEVRAAVAQNSKTAGRQAVQRSSEAVQGGPVKSLMEIRPLKALQDLGQEVTGMTKRASDARTKEMLGEVARLLTEKRGEDAIDILNTLQQRATNPETAAKYGDMATRAGLLFAPVSGKEGAPISKGLLEGLMP